MHKNRAPLDGHPVFIVLLVGLREVGGVLEWMVDELRLHAHSLYVVLWYIRVSTVASCCAFACFRNLKINTGKFSSNNQMDTSVFLCATNAAV
jgi:hypothetical protein